MIRIDGGRRVCTTRLVDEEYEAVLAFRARLRVGGVPASMSDALRVLVQRGLDAIEAEQAPAARPQS